MTILPIRITGEPVLHRRTAGVRADAFGPSLEALAEEMREAMAAAPGVGLAGTQGGVDARVFVWAWTDPSTGQRHEGTVVNPTLVTDPLGPGDPDPDAESEACLSAAGHLFPLRRPAHAVLTGVDTWGVPLRVEARGGLARIFRHEFDHPDGILYLDRL